MNIWPGVVQCWAVEKVQRASGQVLYSVGLYRKYREHLARCCTVLGCTESTESIWPGVVQCWAVQKVQRTSGQVLCWAVQKVQRTSDQVLYSVGLYRKYREQLARCCTVLGCTESTENIWPGVVQCWAVQKVQRTSGQVLYSVGLYRKYREHLARCCTVLG
ncbi:hypothetical protein DPMN_050790 [Dreissena polymorpha]|uniref:Uncharacterized protein n=1 Tax=Dreissena polymorpha TaxID=45954 RepID=A0A9D4HPN3_DREPO|nr:hypothetical protein DPMN_050790 [Dreissena polymorpha]